MGSDSQEKVQNKRSAAMSIIQCVGFVAFLVLVLNITLFKGKLVKKVQKELKADIKALRGISNEVGENSNSNNHNEKERAPKRPSDAYEPDFNQKKPLNHDVFDELYMEEEMIKKGMMPMDEFHKVNHLKIKHHADAGH